MPDEKISQLTTITTVDINADLLPIVDTSATETKKITPSALKAALALNEVDNTSDADKPISTAVQSALDAKASTTALSNHVVNTSNPHNVTKSQVGLSNVDNTSDANKPISTATQTALDGKQNTLGFTPENVTNKGANNGYASLDSTGKVPSTQLPSYVDDIVEVANYAALPATGETGKIYITLDNNNIYRWSGSVYVQIAQPNAVWGGITGTLSNQTDLQSALNAKQDTLVSGTNIKTINSTSVLGSGDIAVQTTITGAATTITSSDLTASRAVVSNASGKVSVSSVTSTELGYVSGVTSAIQTQIDTKTNKLITANRQTASYTLVAGDADKLVEMNVASANNLTVPASTFSAGTQILLAQYGAGQTTIVAGSGMTIRSNGGKLKLSAQYSGATLVFISATEAYLFGDIAS